MAYERLTSEELLGALEGLVTSLRLELLRRVGVVNAATQFGVFAT